MTGVGHQQGHAGAGGATGPERGAGAGHQQARPGFDGERLRRLLGGPESMWLLDRLRRRLAQGRPLRGPVTLQGPTPAQRQLIESLLARPPGRGTSLSFPLEDLDAALRRSGIHPDGLAGAVDVLIGEVTTTADARAATVAAWDAACADLAAVTAAHDGLRAWYAEPHTGRLIRRLGGTAERAAPMLADLARVLAALPARGVPLARFAADTTERSHALDQGRPLATLALSAVRAVWPPAPSPDRTPAQWRRELWASVGVYVDELSSTVLTLNVPLGRLTGPACDAGEPVVLTLRQLTRRHVTGSARHVFACENPAVVAAAADELGPACPPVVCVNGQPTTAVLRLLQILSRDGAVISYHGDFDWGGVRIANVLGARFDWRPWRFETAAYEAALASGRHGGQLAGEPVDARWDASLRDALIRGGHRVEEELVLADLLADLAEPGQRWGSRTVSIQNWLT